MISEELKNQLRYLKLEILSFLLTLATTDRIALDLSELSTSTSTAEPNLKGIIGTLRRMKVKDGKPLIQPAGRDSQGRLTWKIDETVVSKKDLANFLENEILGKGGWRVKKS